MTGQQQVGRMDVAKKRFRRRDFVKIGHAIWQFGRQSFPFEHSIGISAFVAHGYANSAERTENDVVICLYTIFSNIRPSSSLFQREGIAVIAAHMTSVGRLFPLETG